MEFRQTNKQTYILVRHGQLAALIGVTYQYIGKTYASNVEQPVQKRTVSAAVDLPWLFIFPTNAICKTEEKKLHGKHGMICLPRETAPRFVLSQPPCAAWSDPLEIKFAIVYDP